MRKNRILSITLVLTLTLVATAQEGPKAFHKYCVITSVTGGPSKVLYETKASDGTPIHSEVLDANIDPTITEYGLTDKIGLGITRGSDNLSVNTNKFYRQNISEELNEHMMAISTKYYTFDVSYHYFTTKRFDFSVFGSAGYFKVMGATYGQNYQLDCPQALYSYHGRGGVIRTGARARWYFSKRWGLMAMIYGYKGFIKEPNRPNPISDAKSSGSISTSLTGIGSEFGICLRLGRQKNIQTVVPKEKKTCRRKNDDWDNDKEPLITIID